MCTHYRDKAQSTERSSQRPTVLVPEKIVWPGICQISKKLQDVPSDKRGRKPSTGISLNFRPILGSFVSSSWPCAVPMVIWPKQTVNSLYPYDKLSKHECLLMVIGIRAVKHCCSWKGCWIVPVGVTVALSFNQKIRVRTVYAVYESMAIIYTHLNLGSYIIYVIE